MMPSRNNRGIAHAARGELEAAIDQAEAEARGVKAVLAKPYQPADLERALVVFRNVLGFAWQVQAVAAEQTDDDLARANSETTFLQETFAFFQGIKPGDFPAVEKRYRARQVR